jgi:hypothetical protein
MRLGRAAGKSAPVPSRGKGGAECTREPATPPGSIAAFRALGQAEFLPLELAFSGEERGAGFDNPVFDFGKRILKCLLPLE